MHLREHEILLDLPGNFAADMSERLQDGERLLHAAKQVCRIGVRFALPLRGGKKTVAIGSRMTSPDRSLIHALRRAHSMLEFHRGLPFVKTAPVSRYNRDHLALAFLAPDIQRDILADRQPSTLSLEDLRHIDILLCWTRQREVLGWAGLPRGKFRRSGLRCKADTQSLPRMRNSLLIPCTAGKPDRAQLAWRLAAQSAPKVARNCRIVDVD